MLPGPVTGVTPGQWPQSPTGESGHRGKVRHEPLPDGESSRVTLSPVAVALNKVISLPGVVAAVKEAAAATPVLGEERPATLYKHYPPFSPEDKERVERMMLIASVRKELAAMGYPPNSADRMVAALDRTVLDNVLSEILAQKRQGSDYIG